MENEREENDNVILKDSKTRNKIIICDGLQS